MIGCHTGTYSPLLVALFSGLQSDFLCKKLDKDAKECDLLCSNVFL